MEEIEIPPYFLCPISYQIMKDPVTTITGITYDRECIEQWINTTTSSDQEEATSTTCPFTKLPLPKDSDLTPNHMLRHLIQSWCTTNARYGIDRIPTPKSPLSRTHVRKLIRNLNVGGELYKTSLTKIEELANENEKNRKCMMENGVVRAMVMWIVRLHKERKVDGLEDILRILVFVWGPIDENVDVLKDNYDLIQSLTWVLSVKIENQEKVKTLALRIMKKVLEVSSTKLMENLKYGFFVHLVNVIHLSPTNQAVKCALHILIQVCKSSRNRIEIIETGVIFEVIELELGNSKDKKMSELNMTLLAELCGCADGRAQLLKHAGAIAVVTERILRVSASADDQGVHILALVSRHSATNEVLMEMLRVKAVSKLCMVIQADCGPGLKKKASEILRLHANVWSTSPCIDNAFLNA